MYIFTLQGFSIKKNSPNKLVRGLDTPLQELIPEIEVKIIALTADEAIEKATRAYNIGRYGVKSFEEIRS